MVTTKLCPEQLQQQLDKLEKQNRLLQKKLYRSEKNRQELESFFDVQMKVVSQTIQELETSKAETERREQELQLAFDDLKSMQAKLVESEKMSALGVLVAGIAHEINNPINFIHANINHAKDYVQDLLDLISLYQEIYPEPDPQISALTEEKDLNFVFKDIGKLISSMRIGSDRIRNIVLGLRNFSRLDEAVYKDADLHDGIESTLMILQHRFKATSERAAIKIDKAYGQLPQVSCFSGQLNQVFMNILGNAIDSIEEQSTRSKRSGDHRYQGQISIRTSILDSQQIEISIADNGVGIEEAVQQKIFDPFFTTKPVGSGTGLGMSISYKIVVENHKGHLACCSKSDQGAEFIIQIPLRQPSDNSA